MNARRTQQPAPAHPLFDTAAEAEVLGYLLIDPATGWPEASAAGLTGDDFTSGEHRLVFAAAREQYEKDQDADVIGVYERLRAQGVQDDDLRMRLNALAQSAAPGLSALRRLSRMLHEQGHRRKLAAAVQSGTLADALELAEQIRYMCESEVGDGLPRLDVRAACEAPDDPKLDFVIPGLLSGTVGGLVAPGSAGKSMIALMMAASVASGDDLLGFDDEEFSFSEKPGRVLYLTKEDPDPILERRVRAIGRLVDQNKKGTYYDNMDIANLLGSAAAVHDAAWLARITRRAQGARLVIIDTLRRFHEWDENSSGEMARLLGYLERLAVMGPPVLFLHHTSRAGALQGAGMQQASRGSTVLVDNIRFQAQLNTLSAEDAKLLGIDAACRRDFVVYSRSKANYVRSGAGIHYKRGPGGVLEPAHLGRAGVVATGQPLQGARVEDSVRRGGVVINGRDGWEVLR
jgi:regulatory protein RepA